MVKFSIIMPAYNCQEYIEECLNSVLKQEYKNYEIIIVDDGSTDKTGEILEKYKNNKKIKYLYQENSGAPTARNKGIEVSSGEYLIFLDADDKLTENILEIIDSKLDSMDDMLIGNYKTIDKNGDILENHIDYNVEKNFSGEDIFKLCIKDPKPSTKVYRAKVVKENKLKFDNVKIGQDLNFFVKYLMFAKNIKVINEFMYSYRILNGSISRTYTYKILKIIETFEYIKDLYYSNNHIEEYNNYIIYAEMLHYYYQFCKLRFFGEKKERDYIANEFNKHASLILGKRKNCFDKNTLKKLNKFYLRLIFRKFFTSEINKRIYLFFKGIKL